MLFWLLNPRNSMASNDLFPQVLQNPCYVVFFFFFCMLCWKPMPCGYLCYYKHMASSLFKHYYSLLFLALLFGLEIFSSRDGTSNNWLIYALIEDFNRR